VNLLEFRSILRQTLIFPVLLLLMLAGFILWQIGEYRASLRAIDLSDEVISEVIDLEKLVIDQETGLRGYQLTGDTAMLTPYKGGIAPIPLHFAQLHQLLSDNPDQLSRLAQLQDSYQLWLGFAQGMLNKDPAIVNDPQMNQHGKQMMDNLRGEVNGMLQSEERRRKHRSSAALHFERRQVITIVIASLAVGTLLGLFTINRLRRVSRTYSAALEELKKQREEIYESRQWFQTTLESIGDAVMACDNDGRVTFINLVAQNLTGWSTQEALEQPLSKVFHIINEETREEVENPVEKVRRLKSVVGLANHTALISKQGKEYVIDDSAAPIHDKDGEIIGIVLVFRDVTDARRTEAALVAGEKLAVAGRLAASIAHEIHNPLDSVANLHFLLANESDAEKRAHYLHLAQQELGRTMQISRTLLSLYREPKAPVPVDLKDLAEGVLLLLERRLVQQDIRVECEFVESCFVQGFPAELRQVFTNIVVNALEATGKGDRIRIRIAHVPADETRGSGMMVEVADSGSGISEHDRRHVFQPFYTTKGEEGTGLGLWVSMGIVQKHGGTIRIANCTDEDLRGACVQVYLPERTLASASNRSTAHVRAQTTEVRGDLQA
jgi:PAS domain S-box-containing protein